MGADLYIEKLDREKQCTGFRTDVEAGYYRDCYNSTSLLWKLGLSWWRDVGGLIRENKGTEHEGKLTPEQCKEFLKMLKEKESKLDEIENKREQKFYKKEFLEWKKKIKPLKK